MAENFVCFFYTNNLIVENFDFGYSEQKLKWF